MREITESLFEISLGAVNAHLIALADELILIDTGSPGDDVKIGAALQEIGRTPADLTHIIVTHCHPDHAGGLAALQAQSDAVTLMHSLDAAMVRAGQAMRTLTPAPGLLTSVLFRLFIAPAPRTIASAQVDQTIEDGQVLPAAGGLRVLHTPGHSAGQIALLWEERGVLFAADAVTNIPRLGYSLGYEDFALGRQSASRLAAEAFDIACFGHGKALAANADARLRRRFPAISEEPNHTRGDTL